MNYKARALAVLVAATATSAATAADGTINFNGFLMAETCTVAVNNGQASGTTVTLPTLSTSVLSAAGLVAGQTFFNIQLSKCSASLKTAAAYFEGGGTVDSNTGNLRNSGGATKVQLQLVDATNGKVIKAGDTGQVATTSRIDIDGKTFTAELPYAVQYFAEAATGPGTVVSSVTYSINYQ
ncbi:fimbrial protein [Pseudomonas sp. Irchel 3H3]|uniref:fimbrial protein n=1 Tax=Pseudomonas sp. Irchel 3H3 TaxID=2009038 RepID=UPI000BA2E296|nr:fimbrial protein [Pseudomonas sp. Irchel 3H3]